MAEERPTLYLIDGSGYIFRAFFALPQLNNSRGLPTNAVYGFIRMLLKLLKEERPRHIAVVFDSPRKTFRDDLFESYKANRVEAPNDLTVQIPYILRAVEAFRIKSLVLEGFEADDVIGTLAGRAAAKRFDTVIVTEDKDFMQLVGPHVTLWNTMRDRRVDAREVRARLGVDPSAVIDVMALMGDSIDNVKGVPGIGEKTATALIKHFGSLDKLYANLAQVETIPGLRGAKRIATLLAEHRADAELARKLVSIETGAPVEADVNDLDWPGIDERAVSELLRELEFHSLLNELTPAQAALPMGGAQRHEREVKSGEVAALIARLARAPRLALHLEAGENLADAVRDDLETDGSREAGGSRAASGSLDFSGGAKSSRTEKTGGDAKASAAASSAESERLKIGAEGETETYVLPAASIAAAAPLLGAATPPKICHDLKEHLRRLKSRYGVALAGVDFDTMLAGFLVNPGRPEPSLTNLYHDYLAPLGGNREPGSEPELIAALRKVLMPKLAENGLESLFSDIELPVARILAEMEETGIAVDGEALKAISAELGAKLEHMERNCYLLAGRQFNLNSPIQLRQVLFDDLKLSAKGLKKTRGGFSTDADTLEKLAAVHPLPRQLLEYRAIAKLKSTYSDALPQLIDPATGRLHTSFHQALTATGRLSSTDPNLQNIPTRTEEGRRIRRAFVAAPGCLMLSADYSQIELRVLAHLSGDPTLIDAFRRGEDIHARTAAEVLGRRPDEVDAEARRLAKVINFGIIYGMGPQRLAGELGISLKEASEYIKRYFERLPGVHAYLEESLSQARERGWVATMYGRRRYLPELNSPQGGARAQAERIAVNTPLQGTAADLIKLAMIRLDGAIKEQKWAARMLLQVHDELLLELPHAEREPVSEAARREMEGVAELRIPLKVELKWGPNWAALEGRRG
ncbi:MAG TPA: DNA polymerase I [Candidatus Binataceae bacterium]|nr:DNA polymerase I [Candidatus Binataceae bacterium]